MATRQSKDKVDFSNPPAGKIYIPIPTNEEDIKLSGIDRRFVTTHVFSATRTLVKMVLIDEADAPAADAYIQDIKTECKRSERQSRCMIESPKTGKKIRCPGSCRCGTDSCPRKDGEKTAPLSYERWIEDAGSEPAAADNVSDTVIADITTEMFMKTLTPILEQMTRMLLAGEEPETIMVALGIKKSRFYEMRKLLQKLYKDYF